MSIGELRRALFILANNRELLYNFSEKELDALDFAITIHLQERGMDNELEKLFSEDDDE